MKEYINLSVDIKEHYIKKEMIKILDDWLEEGFSYEKKLIDSKKYEELVFNRLLALIESFFQTARFPIFEKPSLLAYSYDNKKQTYKIKFEILSINNISTEFYKKIIIDAFTLIFKYCFSTVSKSKKQDFFSEVEQKIYKKYKGLVGDGKCYFNILDSAYKLNIPYIYLGDGVYQIGFGINRKLLYNSSTNNDSFSSLSLVSNKYTTEKLLFNAGIPTTKSILISDSSTLLEAKKLIGFPLVTKPVDMDRGEGITLNINDDETLIKGFEYAKETSPTGRVLIQTFEKGICHRIFVVNGEHLYTVKRVPMYVVGNGTDNVDTLIKTAQKKEDDIPPWKRVDTYPLDDETIKVIKSFGFTLNSIPKEKERVYLREVESTQWGGGTDSMTDLIHPENLSIAIKAAKIFGLSIAGVDILSEDITKPWYENGAVLNEINAAPELGLSGYSKQMVPKYFDKILENKGVIPIKVILGDYDKAYKKKVLSKYSKNIKNTYVISDDFTLLPNGNLQYIDTSSLVRRYKALVLDPDVEQIIILVKNDELLYSNTRITHIDEIIINNEDITKQESDKKIKKEEFKQLVKLLESNKFEIK